MTLAKDQLLFIAFAVLALALWPFASNAYGIDLLSKIMIYAILALGLELLVGTTGLVCFGQAAFFGIGAYSALWFSPAYEAGNALIIVLLCMAMAALYALFVGALSLRTKGVYFIMVTLAFAQMAYYVIHDTPVGGGTDGIYLTAAPTFLGLDLASATTLYYLIFAALWAVFAFLTLLLRSNFGRVLSGIRVSEQRLRACGYATYPYKLAAFVLSGAIAGMAGFLFAVKDGYVNPELLSWHISGAVLIMIILGGLGHLRGALIGAFAFSLLQEFFKSDAILGAYAKHWQLGLGLSIIVDVALLPKGLVSLPSLLWDKLQGRMLPTRAATRARKAAGEGL